MLKFKISSILCTVIFLSIIFLLQCKLNDANNNKIIKGEGPLVMKEVPLDSIELIVQLGSGIMKITRGSQQKVVLRAQQNILNYITASVDNYMFVWGFNDNIVIDPATDSIIVEIQVSRNIRTIRLAGSGNIFADGPKQKSLRLELYGAGNILCFGLPVQNCDITFPGQGACQVTVSDTLTGILSGQGNIYYRGSPVIQCPITGSGNLINDN